jgi:hypothetical protein
VNKNSSGKETLILSATDSGSILIGGNPKSRISFYAEEDMSGFPNFTPIGGYVEKLVPFSLNGHKGPHVEYRKLGSGASKVPKLELGEGMVLGKYISLQGQITFLSPDNDSSNF